MNKTRKYLSAKGLFNLTKHFFSTIPGQIANVVKGAEPINLSDCLMSGLAVFSLKYPSLLKFEEEHKKRGTVRRNLKTLFGVHRIPADTTLRERIDEIDPKEIRKIFKNIFAKVQRGKALEAYKYLDDYYLMPLDGTGFYSSDSVHCENCCVKNNKKCNLKIDNKLPDEDSIKKKVYYLVKEGKELPWQLLFFDKNKTKFKINITCVEGLSELLHKEISNKLSKEAKTQVKAAITNYHIQVNGESYTYYHNMLCGAIVHPDKKTVFPFAPEPILKSDGKAKNDCEHNAATRFMSDLKREHPHLKLIVVQDSIAANYPNLNMHKKAGARFIVGVKPGDHKLLFEWVNSSKCSVHEHVTKDGTTHKYHYLNNAPLNNRHHEFKVNFIEYWETDKKGKKQHFCWVTDILITDDNCYDIMRGGRSNWRIENNTFNTLKNQGYHFGHNFGHGHKNLSTNFGMLMLLAFFIDQVQQACCQMWQKARGTYQTRSALFNNIRSLFFGYIINSWDDVFVAIAYGQVDAVLVPDTS